jgi:hypothetical protein
MSLLSSDHSFIDVGLSRLDSNKDGIPCEKL